jgi:hypothetical protein
MQAIETKYLEARNHRGSRIVARCAAKRIVLSWDHALNTEQNHRAAARELITQMGWFGTWCSGSIPSGSDVHVNVRRVEPNWIIGNYEVWDVWQDMDTKAA